MKFTRRTTLGMLATTLATPAFAMKPKVFETDAGAIRGYDPVAYFAEKGPVKGSDAHTSVHNGATFKFASAENKATFDADPATYAPQYGGYCSYAVSKGYTATTDPDAWSIVDNKLYLNYSKSVRLIWKQDIPGNIQKADANWPGVLA